MKTKNLESFGNKKHYSEVIDLVKNDKTNWRKVANLLGNLRQNLRFHPVVDRSIQLKESEKSLRESLIDTKLPESVATALKRGIKAEFNFTFE